MSENIKILLVEDDEVDRMSVIRALKKSGKPVTVTQASDATAGLSALSKEPYDCVLLDYRLPDINGIEFLDQLNIEVPVIMLTDSDDEKISMDSVKHGAQDYLIKEEVNGSSILRAVRYAIERQRLTAALRELSLIDYQTGLYNKKGFMLFAQQHILVANRRRSKICLFLFDIDGLNDINIKHGYEQGNQLIVETAKIIKESFRVSDVVARLGKDEFAILALEADISGTQRIIDSLNARVKVRNSSPKAHCEISLSVGIAQYNPHKPCGIEDLIILADKKLYQHKKIKKRHGSVYIKVY